MAASTTARWPRSGEMEKDIVLRFRAAAARPAREVRQIPRGDDAHRRHLHPAGRSRPHGAHPPGVAVHLDPCRCAASKGEGEAQGATIYTLSETASDAEAARLAESENRADVIAGIDLSHEPDDVADILIDLAQRETKAFSLQFAKTLVGEMKKVARMHKHPMKSAGFMVLKAPDVPSVLVELGYVSSKDDLKQLTSGAWQAKTAGAIGAGDRQFLQHPAGRRHRRARAADDRKASV